MRKLLLLFAFFIVSDSFGQEKVTLNGNFFSESVGISKVNMKSIISFFNGDIVMYQTNRSNRFTLTISKELANKKNINEKISFVILNEAVPFYKVQNFRTSEIPRTGKWTLTKFPNSDLYYVDKVEHTPFSTENKEKNRTYYNNYKKTIDKFIEGDEKYVMQFLRYQLIPAIRGSKHRLFYFDIATSIIELTDSKYEEDSQQRYSTLPDKLSYITAKYLKHITTSFNNDIIDKNLSKSEWEKWWNKIITTEAFPPFNETKSKTIFHPSTKYGLSGMRYNNGNIYFNTGKIIFKSEIKTDKIIELTNNPFLNFEFNVIGEDIFVLGEGIKINGNKRFAKYSEKNPITTLVNPIEIQGTDSIDIRQTPIKITQFNNIDLLVYHKNRTLNIKSINSDGVSEFALKEFIPKCYEHISSINNAGEHTNSTDLINSKRLLNIKLIDIFVLPENERLSILFTLESSYFNKKAKNIQIKTLHFLSLDKDFNIIKDFQLNSIDKNDWKNSYKQLNIAKSENYYLLSWIFREGSSYKTLRGKIFDNEFETISKEFIIAETDKNFGAISNNDIFYSVFSDDPTSRSIIKILGIDKTGTIKKTFKLLFKNKSPWHLAKTVEKNKLHIFINNLRELEEKIISLD